MKLKYLIIVVCLAWTTTILADTTANVDGSCASIQIVNLSNATCSLEDFAGVYSVLIPNAPKKILAQDSKAFMLCPANGYHNMQINLTYQCNTGKIAFEIAQPWAIFTSQTPSLKITNQQGLTLTSSIAPAAIWNAIPSKVDITINQAS